MTQRFRRAPRAWLAPAALALVAAATAVAAGGGDPSAKGAYCAFPKKGEIPQCFAAVEAEYGDFFDAAGAGRVDDAHVAVLEQKLASRGSDEEGFLAISSLAYGYFRLAEVAASTERPDPALVARLNRLNEVLSSVYEGASPQFQVAVRAAAEDLHARAPAVATECAEGASDDACQTTGRLLAALKAIDDPSEDSAVRDALGRLYERVTGTGQLTVPAGDPSP